MSTIIEVHGREILDSRGNPTVEAEVVLSSGAQGRAAVPSGASTGEHEAVELRDGDAGRYGGKGVLRRSRTSTRCIGPRLEGLDADGADRGRRRDDGCSTARPTRASSAPMPCSRCRSRWPARPPQDCGLPLYRYLGGPMARVLPVPMMNILNGGAHASNNVDAQEFMVVPIGADTFGDGLRMGVEVFHALKKVLTKMRPVHRRGRRGRVRADAALQRGGARRGDAGDPGGGLRAGAGHRRSRSTSRPRSSTRTASTSSRRATAAAAPPRTWSSSTRSGATAIRSSRSRTASPRTTGTAGRSSPERLDERVQLVGDDLFCTNVDRLGGASSRAWPTRSWSR